MTQVTTVAESGDQVAIAPGWIKRAAGFLALFSGMVLSALLIFSNAVPQGLLVAVLTLIGLPLLSILASLIWRFYWYMITGALCVLLLTGLALWWGISTGVIKLGREWNDLRVIILRGNTIGFVFAILLAAIVTASLIRVYTLWQIGALGRLRRQIAGDDDPLFNFETRGPSPMAANASLMDRVLAHLLREGHRGEQHGDLIHVYKRRDFVGIVRVVESAGAISPLIVKDVEKHRAKLGVQVAYLATAGWFTEDVRRMAHDLGIKLITV